MREISEGIARCDACRAAATMRASDCNVPGAILARIVNVRPVPARHEARGGGM